MTEDLLEEMDGGMAEDSLGTVQSQEASGKGSLIRRLLDGKQRLLPSKKRVFLILSAGVAVIAILAGVWFFFLKGASEDSIVSKDIPAMEKVVQTGGNESGSSDLAEAIVFEDIIVLTPFERIRLKGGSAMGLISLNVSMELMDLGFKTQVVSAQERIRKIIEGQVLEMRWDELRNPEGKIHLKYELLKRINSVFPKVMVRNVYFTNLIMQ